MGEWFNIENPSQMISSITGSLMQGVLNLLLIVGYIVICWLVVKFIAFVLKRAFKLLRLHKVQQLIDQNEFLSKFNFSIKVDGILIFFVKVFMVFLMVVVGAELFGLSVVSKEIGNLMLYIPQAFVALIIFVGGLYFASWVKKAIVQVLKAMDFSGARLIGNIVFYLILVFVVITTLNQIGINTDIITNNISIIVGAILLTIALSLGLGAKDVVTRLLYSFYTRKNLELGQEIKINGLQGYVISVDNIYLCLLVDGKKHFLPIAKVSESHIEVIK